MFIHEAIVFNNINITKQGWSDHATAAQQGKLLKALIKKKQNRELASGLRSPG